MKKLVIFRRDTERKVKWLDYDHGIYDEVWHRWYTIFGVLKIDFTFTEYNHLEKADHRGKRPISGFNNINRDGK